MKSFAFLHDFSEKKEGEEARRKEGKRRKRKEDRRKKKKEEKKRRKDRKKRKGKRKEKKRSIPCSYLFWDLLWWLLVFEASTKLHGRSNLDIF